jgi:hypothetical protein
MLHDRALRQFGIQTPGIQPSSFEGANDGAREILLPELLGRHVHGHPEVGQARALPLLRLGAGLAEDPVADGKDQTRFLGEGYEVQGENHSQFRTLPANQRLRSDDLARV